ncbi:hypothetical protein ACFQ1Q_05745 [Winogradskyella litorisediminis]|uniref:DUF4412 domain-containing protein n=1 Tax=Winogradskyella litorisediminis TaxID=1156618 RepID=A0ABW3N5L9_9FLAO
MRFTYSIILIACFVFTSLGQTGFYVKYKAEFNTSSEDAEMMKTIMNGSSIEVAANANNTWVKTNMGLMMTMTMELDVELKKMTMFMTGTMGNMAFSGNTDSLKDDEEQNKTEVELIDETKKILGVNCKKAITKDEFGNVSTYWYTENFKRPEGMKQMPSNVPGLCLQFITESEEFTISYTAVEFNDNAKMKDYKVVIPEGTEIKSLEEMKNMGVGG